jgi:Phosphoesterase family
MHGLDHSTMSESLPNPIERRRGPKERADEPDPRIGLAGVPPGALGIAHGEPPRPIPSPAPADLRRRNRPTYLLAAGLAVVATMMVLAPVASTVTQFAGVVFAGPGHHDQRHPVTFSESGLPGGTPWSVTLGSQTGQARAPGQINFQERTGTYSFTVGAVTGYTAQPSDGTVTVAAGGGATNEPITFSPSSSPPPSISHVVVIVMENQEESAVLKGAPYLSYLADTYGSASSFYAACHESLPEYAAMTSGESFTCTSIPIEGATNIADTLQAKGDSWDAYFESMPTACDIHSHGAFVSYHDPFILYKDIRYNATRCDEHILNSQAFNQSLASGMLPTYSYYIPNTDDDGENTSLAYGDTWLQSFLAPILNSTQPSIQKLVSTTAFFVVFDEGSDSDLSGYSSGGVVSSWCQSETGQPLSVCGGHTYMVVVSPYSHHTTYSADATDYNLESTVEMLLGLPSDGGNDGTAAFPAMSSLFTGK